MTANRDAQGFITSPIFCEHANEMPGMRAAHDDQDVVQARPHEVVDHVLDHAAVEHR